MKKIYILKNSKKALLMLPLVTCASITTGCTEKNNENIGFIIEEDNYNEAENLYTYLIDTSNFVNEKKNY